MMINPLIEAANWFLAFYSVIPQPVHWLCAVVVINFFTISVLRMLMRM